MVKNFNLNSVATNNEPLPTASSLANDWLTPQQLQEQIGISIRLQEVMRTKKRQLKDKNPLPFCKFGKAIRYNKARISKWLLDNEVRIQDKESHHV